MRNKHDMYIDYERSYRRHRRKGNNKFGLILLLIIILAGIGFAIFMTVKARIDWKSFSIGEEAENSKGDSQGENTANSEQHDDGNLAGVTPEAASPSPQPTPAVTQAVVDENPTDVGARSREPVKVKGIYLTSLAAASVSFDNLIELANNTEINAMVIDVKDDHGKISYQMDSAVAKEIGAVTNTIADINALITRLKEKNIYIIARIVAFKDPYLAEQRQEMAIKNPDGSLFRDENGEGWVNPYNRKIWDYLIDIATQAAASGFDEIQFDYIRFSTGKGIADADFGEEAKTKSKEEIITEFTKYAYEKIKPLGVFVSADVYGTIISSSVDSGLVGQNYVEMSKYLDYICPMIYPSHFGTGNYGVEHPDLEPYMIIRKVLTASKTKLDTIPATEHRAIVRPWLQAFTATWVEPHMEYGGEELKEQFKGVYSVGYEEWLLWNASGKYSGEGLEPEQMD